MLLFHSNQGCGCLADTGWERVGIACTGGAAVSTPSRLLTNHFLFSVTALSNGSFSLLLLSLMLSGNCCKAPDFFMHQPTLSGLGTYEGAQRHPLGPFINEQREWRVRSQIWGLNQRSGVFLFLEVMGFGRVGLAGMRRTKESKQPTLSVVFWNLRPYLTSWSSSYMMAFCHHTS